MKIKLEGYFDSSGKEDSEKDTAIIVAGLLATPHQWRKFDKIWLKTLSSENVPLGEKLPVFHTTDFQARVSPYNSWTQEKRDGFYKKLIDIISGNTLYPVGMAILLEDYYKFAIKNPESLNFFGSAGNFAACLCFYHCSAWADKMNYHDTISYIFDRGDRFRPEIEYQHKKMCEMEQSQRNWRFKDGGLSFQNKEFFTPIQAADVLAWEISKDIKKMESTTVEKGHRVRPSFLALDLPCSDFKIYSYEDLQWFWTVFASDLREEIEQQKSQNF